MASKGEGGGDLGWRRDAEPVQSSSYQLPRAGGHCIGSLKLTMVRIFTPRKLANSVCKSGLFFFLGEGLTSTPLFVGHNLEFRFHSKFERNP